MLFSLKVPRIIFFAFVVVLKAIFSWSARVQGAERKNKDERKTSEKRLQKFIKEAGVSMCFPTIFFCARLHMRCSSFERLRETR